MMIKGKKMMLMMMRRKKMISMTMREKVKIHSENLKTNVSNIGYQLKDHNKSKNIPKNHHYTHANAPLPSGGPPWR